MWIGAAGTAASASFFIQCSRVSVRITAAIFSLIAFSFRERLTGVLVENLYGSDLEWLAGGRLVGLPEPPWSDEYDYNLTFYGQPGYRFR